MSLSLEPTAAELQHASRRLEAMGFQVGQRLAERYTKDRPRFVDTLEIIKFICKDFWFEIYGKQIDKLQTNNRVRRRMAEPGQLRLAKAVPGRLFTHPAAPLFRVAGRVYASGQPTSAAGALLALSRAASECQGYRGPARQIPGGAYSRRATRAGRLGGGWSRGDRLECVPVHNQDPATRRTEAGINYLGPGLGWAARGIVYGWRHRVLSARAFHCSRFLGSRFLVLVSSCRVSWHTYCLFCLLSVFCICPLSALCRRRRRVPQPSPHHRRNA